MRITWKGAGSLIIETERSRILTDPCVTLIGGSNPCAAEDFGGADAALITGTGWDRLLTTAQILESTDMTAFCGLFAGRLLDPYLEDAGQAAVIRPGMEFPLGDCRIKVLRGAETGRKAGASGAGGKTSDERAAAGRKTGRRAAACGRRPAPGREWAGHGASGRFLRNIRNVPFLIWAGRNFGTPEENLVYEIRAEGKVLLLSGEAALSQQEDYPVSPDVLVLPYRYGNVPEDAAAVLGRIAPKRVILTGFDDYAPPFTHAAPLKDLSDLLKREFPGIAVVKPAAGKAIRI